jgi:23S rRNA (uracil1939-C5)-methyltransferase
MNYAYDEHHNIISGYYVEGSHVIVPIDECQICDENINRILYSIKRIVSRLHISIFDERIMKGCLRHVLVRSTNKGEYMVVLVTGSPNIVKKEQLIGEILKYNPDVKTIVQNINRNRTSMVLGPRNVTLYGKGYITDRLCGLDFRISPSSFYQVNRRQTEILYRTAIETAGLKKDEVLLDAYCGTGTIGLSAASSVNRVIGVEVNPSAVKDADVNRKINGIDNAEFICEDAGRYMEQLAKEKKHIDTVIMDPPRAGSDDHFLKSLMRLSPDKVVYISCNPVTLKRDLNVLKKQYRIKKIQPVDMFPFTEHVETVVLLSRKQGQGAENGLK